MRTATSNYTVEGARALGRAGTYAQIQGNGHGYSEAYPPEIPGEELSFRLPWSGGSPAVVLAAVLTAHVTYFDPQSESQRSGVYSAVFHTKAGIRSRVSLLEARQLALRILAETDSSLQQERVVEARFLASVWDDDGV